ncbi:hypothetical protein C8F01DRAFT_1085452 [Mycena amicta]|nr:hypothetical protein C8F01DRAFT_1085452 [Mycena amicta]
MDLGTNFVNKLELVSDATSVCVLRATRALQHPGVVRVARAVCVWDLRRLLELTSQSDCGRQLSIVSLGSKRRILPYSDLLRALDMPTIRGLEDLIIDAIYLDVLHGRLDQKQSQLELEYTMGRDLAPGATDAILVALKDWAETTSSVLQTLDDKLLRIGTHTTARKTERAEHQEILEGILREVTKEKSSRRGAALGMGMGANTHYADAMDVDEPGMGMGMGMMGMGMMGMGQENRTKGRKQAMQESSKPVRKRNRF